MTKRPERYRNSVIPHIYVDGASVLGRTTAGLHILVDDNTALQRRAIEAGCEQIQAPTEMFYGANSASLRDPFGHVWVLLTWNQDLGPEEMERRGKQFFNSNTK